jgi:hypothetical protein
MEVLYDVDGYIYVLPELRRKRTCNMVWKIVFIICIILTKWSLAHFAELRDLNKSAQNAY